MKYFKQIPRFGMREGTVYAVPTVDECALTQYFWWNGECWCSELSDFNEVYKSCVRTIPDLVIQEISGLEVLILVGSVPKISSYDSMEHRNDTRT